MPDDIRSQTIAFIMAFLIRGDSSTKKAVLEIKNFVNLIFKDLAGDAFGTIEFVLSTLQKSVVDDTAVPVSTKLRFFTKRHLAMLIGLYSLSDLSIARIVSPTDPTTCIADIVHRFLLHLCTIPGSGICFTDSGWYPYISRDELQAQTRTTEEEPVDNTDAPQSGPSTKIHNRALLGILSLLNFTDSLLQRELCMKILVACPELVHPFWTTAINGVAFEPRSAVNYLSSMALATGIIKLPIPSDFIGKTFAAELVPPPISIAISNILPPVFNRQLSTRSLQHTSQDIRFACAALLATALSKLGSVFDAVASIIHRLKQSDIPNSLTIQQQWLDWTSKLSQKIRNRLPDVQIVIVLHQHVGQQEAGDSVLSVDMQIAALNFIREYQLHFPELWRESRFDFGKLLPSTLSQEPLELQSATVALLKEVPDFKLFSKYRKRCDSGSDILQLSVQIRRFD
eukprot:jgi/Hompol1/2161/HPOL_002092-RA